MFARGSIALLILFSWQPSWGQGCVCQRQNPAVFGGQDQYLWPGQYQVTVGYRGYRSDRHYQGREAFPELDPNGPINRQNQFNVDLTYAVSSRWNLSLNVPLQVSSFSVRRPAPGTGDPVWVPTRSRGLADVSVGARYWLLSPVESKQNVGISFGTTLPTGSASRTDDYFGREVPVDVSVQTGDKSWSGHLGLQANRDFEAWSAYGSINYVFNPRNTTGVPTFFGSLFNPANSTFNSSSDSYIAQFGAAIKMPPKWPTPTVGYRITGVPVFDVFGPSDGFRRPGVFGFFEPGLAFAFGKHMLAFTIPVANYIYVKDSPISGRIEDATIPRYMFTVAYSVRLGKPRL